MVPWAYQKKLAGYTPGCPLYIRPIYILYISTQGVVTGPPKNEKSRPMLPKSRNLAQPTNGSRSLRFCVCLSHICFSI